jgi:uncharacterized protein YchJ
MKNIACPKCHTDDTLKIDEDGPYFCGNCYWERGHKPITVSNKINRNEICPCGSGKKYKKCCIKKGFLNDRLEGC